jgi:hypothetical protein
MYNPVQGRFMQRDQAEYNDGLSLYEYERSSPLTAMDPSGRVVIGLGGKMYIGQGAVKKLLEKAVGKLNATTESRLRWGEGESVNMATGCIGWGRGDVIGLLEAYRDRKDKGWVKTGSSWVQCNPCEEEAVLVGYSDGATLIWQMFNGGQIQKALTSKNGPYRGTQYRVAFVGFIDVVRQSFWPWSILEDWDKPNRTLPLEDGGTIMTGYNYYQQDPDGWKGTSLFFQLLEGRKIPHPRVRNILVPEASHSVGGKRTPIIDAPEVRDRLPTDLFDAYKAGLDAEDPFAHWHRKFAH